MTKITIATLAASALSTLAIGLAAPALAAPSGVGGDNNNVSVADNGSTMTYPMTGQTPYGTYQNDHKARPDAR